MDARLPLRFGALDSRTATEAVLTDAHPASLPAVLFEPSPQPPHGTDCACCTVRTAAATALAQLFRDRALSPGAPFRAVLAVVGPDGEAEIRQALQTDPLVSARYRLIL